MTALKEEAIRMIGNLPEDKVQYVIKYMQTITINRKEREQSEKMKAFSDLENLRLHLPMDFDYEKELEDARKEKYGIIS